MAWLYPGKKMKALYQIIWCSYGTLQVCYIAKHVKKHCAQITRGMWGWSSFRGGMCRVVSSPQDESQWRNKWQRIESGPVSKIWNMTHFIYIYIIKTTKALTRYDTGTVSKFVVT